MKQYLFICMGDLYILVTWTRELWEQKKEGLILLSGQGDQGQVGKGVTKKMISEWRLEA